MPKKPIKKTVISVPQTLEQATDQLMKIGQCQREWELLQAAYNEEVESLRQRFLAESQPLEAQKQELFEGLFAFGQSHRDELTSQNKRKIIDLPTGVFGWRMTPPAVRITNIEEVLKRLETLGLAQFIRTKKEPDKEAMLKNQDLAQTVNGISINQHEEFYVKPADLTLEIAGQVEKLAKKIGD